MTFWRKQNERDEEPKTVAGEERLTKKEMKLFSILVVVVITRLCASAKLITVDQNDHILLDVNFKTMFFTCSHLLHGIT